MNAILRFLRRAWLVIAASFSRQPRWHKCPVCGLLQRDGVATTAQPTEDAWIESEPRICAPCRHDILMRREGGE